MLVVDTNIAFPFIVDGPRSIAARALHEIDPDWRTEPYVFIELSNVLVTYERKNLMTKDETSEFLASAKRLLTPGLVSVSHENALDCALRFRTSAYDARYLAVAETLGALLVTEDIRLRKAAPKLTMSLDEALMAAR